MAPCEERDICHKRERKSVGSQSNHAQTHWHPPSRSFMDLKSARALLLTCKNNPVQGILLESFREEAREFARSVSVFRQDVQPIREPADRCREARGGGRCRGCVPELAVTQMCAYHQTQRTSDLNLDSIRRLSTDSPGLFRWVFGR